MRVPARGRARARSRLAIISIGALAALLALAASAFAVPKTQTYIGQADGPTPDIERTDIIMYLPDGSPSQGGAAGTINLALDGEPVVTYCVDTENFLRESGSVVADVSPVPLTTPEDRAVLWILQNRKPTGTPTPEKQQEAATAQVAVWVLRGQLRATDPTDDPALNAAVAALIDTALAESAVPRTLSLSASSPAAGATTATIQVSAKPGAVVQLAVTSGPGQLSATTVTTGPDGRADVTLTSPSAVATVVSATTAGDGTLFLVKPTDGSQSTTFSAGETLSASTTVTFTAAQTPTVPTVPVAQTPTVRRPVLAVSKRAPSSARVLQRVRYTITVRNRSRAVARNIVLRDRLPRGMSLVRSSRRGTLRGGTLTIRLGNLRPGKARKVNVWLVANATVRGRRVNVVTVSATRTRPVRARAVTVFRPIVRRVQPAVTG